MTKQAIHCFLFPFLLLSTIGCNERVGLSGRVTFSDDGSPLTCGTVCFESPTYLSRGVLKKDGSYVVASLSEKDGIPPGTYRVYITGATRQVGTDAEGHPIFESLVDESNTQADSSKLTVVVDASTRRHDFQVDRPSSQKTTFIHSATQ